MSPDWIAGFCMAWSIAVQSSQQNADHMKQLLSPNVNGTIVDSTVQLVLDGIQTYVVLAPIQPGWSIVLKDGTKFSCP